MGMCIQTVGGQRDSSTCICLLDALDDSPLDMPGHNCSSVACMHFYYSGAMTAAMLWLTSQWLTGYRVLYIHVNLFIHLLSSLISKVFCPEESHFAVWTSLCWFLLLLHMRDRGCSSTCHGMPTVNQSKSQYRNSQSPFHSKDPTPNSNVYAAYRNTVLQEPKDRTLNRHACNSLGLQILPAAATAPSFHRDPIPPALLAITAAFEATAIPPAATALHIWINYLMCKSIWDPIRPRISKNMT